MTVSKFIMPIIHLRRMKIHFRRNCTTEQQWSVLISAHRWCFLNEDTASVCSYQHPERWHTQAMCAQTNPSLISPLILICQRGHGASLNQQRHIPQHLTICLSGTWHTGQVCRTSDTFISLCSKSALRSLKVAFSSTVQQWRQKTFTHCIGAYIRFVEALVSKIETAFSPIICLSEVF